jgi:hypothetical protein
MRSRRDGDETVKNITEAYRPLGDPNDRFDIEFWQRLGPAAIFDAALEMIQTHHLLTEGRLLEVRIDRTVEHFERISDRPVTDSPEKREPSP